MGSCLLPEVPQSGNQSVPHRRPASKHDKTQARQPARHLAIGGEPDQSQRRQVRASTGQPASRGAQAAQYHCRSANRRFYQEIHARYQYRQRQDRRIRPLNLPHQPMTDRSIRDRLCHHLTKTPPLPRWFRQAPAIAERHRTNKTRRLTSE